MPLVNLSLCAHAYLWLQTIALSRKRFQSGENGKLTVDSVVFYILVFSPKSPALLTFLSPQVVVTCTLKMLQSSLDRVGYTYTIFLLRTRIIVCLHAQLFTLQLNNNFIFLYYSSQGYLFI